MAIFDKDKREDKKAARQQKRDTKLEERIQSETSKAGLDLQDLPKGPMTSEAKQNITQGIKESVSDDFAKDIEGFAKSYALPGMKDRPTLDKEALKEDYKKQRRARWTDAMTALGRGLQGKNIDTSQFQTSKMQAEREGQYQQYKDVVAANKATSEKWQHQYRKDLINYLDEKIGDAKTSEMEKLKMRQLKAQIAKTEADAANKRGATKEKPIYTHKTKEGSWQMTNRKNPYSDLYYKLTGNSPTLINEIAKVAGHAIDDEGSLKRNLSSDEIERFSNTLLSKAFDITVDEAGNQVAIPKPGMENFLQDLSTKISESSTIQSEIDRLTQERDEKLYEVSGFRKDAKKQAIETEYDTLLSDLQSKLKQTQDSVSSFLEGNNYTPTPQSQPSTTPEESGESRTTLEDIYNS